ncbi:hypothetical protein SAMN06265348_110266 [Pedobacter westerhofensis]|uniref:Uncharacterized protein n=1 Tax=Pedobacter westerhofensis TaxID=425512 RepID=A0A521F7U6_9SPHI|nr:hypothetical protein [Pedobacter westerhofensis]SMO92268.1 hypothetical protein SAMN06265348_110266 [Pedobacter westerhofensis]
MTPDLNTLRQNFALMNDAALLKLADQLGDLTPQGLQALKEEASNRSLKVAKFINNTFRDQADLDTLIDQKCVLLMNQPCPVCRGTEYLVNAIWLNEMAGGAHGKTFHLACGKCLMEETRMAENQTPILSWLLPLAFFSTRERIKENNRELAEVRTGKPTKSLINRVTQSLEFEFYNAMYEVDIDISLESVR